MTHSAETGTGDGSCSVSVMRQPQLTIVPVYWKEAKAFVKQLHRHHLPGGNGRFCVGVEDEDGTLRGVAVLGRTKARMLPHKHVLEVTRVATDGCANACSALYGASCRIHKPHGYRKAITYTLLSEPGTSLRAAGWRPVAVTDGGSWSRKSRARTDKHPTLPKIRWECPHSELRTIDLREAQIGWLAAALQLAWSAETSADPENWTPENPAYGQCAVTSLIVQDVLGGQLWRGLVDGVSHYWVRLGRSQTVDLTWQQFPDGSEIDAPAERAREYVLSFPATAERYDLLRERVMPPSNATATSEDDDQLSHTDGSGAA